MEKSLENLFAPMTRATFLEHYITNTPVVVHGKHDIISEFSKLPLLESTDSLLSTWPGPVNCYLPGIADEVNSTEVTTTEAGKLFKSGTPIFFDDPNTFTPLLEQWLLNLKADLGLSQMTYARSLIYALPKGSSTAAHFDQNINFILQISGTKKWWIAPNEQIKNPLTRHTMGTPADPELASYLEADLPEIFPDHSATEYELGPGSILFLPRGAWHRTESISSGLALNFTFSAPTWIDIVTSALRGRLAQSPEWRSTADFVNDQELHPNALRKLNSLLVELAEDAQTWRAQDILGATEMNESPS